MATWQELARVSRALVCRSGRPQGRSWADVLTVAAFVGGLALLGALAWWTRWSPPGGRGRAS
jgi:hypothetical protein